MKTTFFAKKVIRKYQVSKSREQGSPPPSDAHGRREMTTSCTGSLWV